MIAVRDPVSGAQIAEVPELTAPDVAALVARAREAQPAWQALGFDGRGQVLRRMQRWVVDNADRIARTIVGETGKAYEDAMLAEVMYGAAAFGFWAKRAPRWVGDRRVRSTAPAVLGKRLLVRYEPLGVVAVIGPWNYPLTNSFGDAIPALAAGNAVILKPSEHTPMTSLLLAEGLAASGVPDGVFAVATGAGPTAEALVDLVDMVQFTGSTATGRAVAVRAAERLIPVSLELGGKDPMIVLADADLGRAANAAVYYAMQNAGQTCISVERVYVEDAVHDEFVRLLAERVASLRQGDPRGGPGTVDVGAMTTTAQVDVVAEHVRDAVTRGATVVAGGERDGAFFPPTVLTDVDHSMLAMREETFGPTLPVMRVRDAEEAIRLANDSDYGLAASVFTGDAARGEAIARRLRAGAVTVNDALINYQALELPMGGWKSSGLGARHGEGGIRKFCAEQAIVVSRWHLRRDIHMHPYRRGRTKALLGALRLLYGRGRR